ncbi:MAG: DUF5946 family protein [Candidatus Palauibacterales bacterium]|nr:DUF5946 family protein [Candidatus Palauibacterales bacterium]MDP2585008.1 DUF5946 family protein [Candidatus Palauibacterales bacterium]
MEEEPLTEGARPRAEASGGGGTEPCPGCGALVPTVDGPTHRYLGASPGCWAAFGRVLAREYSDPAFLAVHGLTVDTYAVQHPGTPSPQTIHSAGVHLVALHLVLERGRSVADAARFRQRAVERIRDRFEWLEPPASLGALTVLDVEGAADADEHAARVRAWARAAWEAWSPHHDTVRGWAARL